MTKVNCLKCEEYELVNGKSHVCWFKGVKMQNPYYIDKDIDTKDEFGNVVCNFHEKEKKIMRNLDDYFELLQK